jgi:hypothetical protein
LNPSTYPSGGCVFRELRARAQHKCRYVFPAEEGAKRAEHLHPESLSRAFARSCGRLGIPGATLHDLRRTCLSGLIELGHEDIAERIAGHAGKMVLNRHYDRNNRLDAMLAALTTWADAVAAARRAIAGKPPVLPAPKAPVAEAEARKRSPGRIEPCICGTIRDASQVGWAAATRRILGLLNVCRAARPRTHECAQGGRLAMSAILRKRPAPASGHTPRCAKRNSPVRRWSGGKLEDSIVR